MSAHKLLVVEDDFLIRLTLVEALQDQGYDVLEADNTTGAADVLRTVKIDLLITDIQLPGEMDGHGLAQAARSRQAGLPVIYMTGRPDPDQQINPLQEAVIAKPYLPSDICKAARRLLENSASV